MLVKPGQRILNGWRERGQRSGLVGCLIKEASQSSTQCAARPGFPSTSLGADSHCVKNAYSEMTINVSKGGQSWSPDGGYPICVGSKTTARAALASE